MIMKLLRSLLPVITSTLFGACANTTFIGHKHAFNLETELKPDMSEPVNINFGYASHSVVVVPPRQPLPTNQLADPAKVPRGDLLSTWSYFKIERTQNAKNALPQFTVRTGVATGLAANNLMIPAPSGASRAARAGVLVAPPAGVGKKMNQILFNP
jgi:hypothetical protein